MSKELEIVKGLIKEQKKQLKNCNWGDSLEMFTCEENINKLEIVKSALERKEKLEKAFALIKDKKVDIWYEIMLSVRYDDYLDQKTDLSEELTQEEYELLKEVLK